MDIPAPYFLFLGDAPDQLAAKVAFGIRDWRPDQYVGQLRLPGCQADVGAEDLTVAEAASRGARTMIVSVANRGGLISDEWLDTMCSALEAGMHLAAGLHNRLADIPKLVEVANANGRDLFDVRHPQETFAVGNGRKRSGKRLLPVGSDCSCGKMYTALAIERELRERGVPADFRATGQTGILIAGSGVPVDAVVADFISGAVEALAPDAAEDHWDVIEGQGSLFHPSYAGVTVGLVHGAQPDALVLCHEPTRIHMRGLPDYPIPDLGECLSAYVRLAGLTNPDVRFVGAAINTKELDEAEAKECLEHLETMLNLPTVDPIRTGVGRIVDALDG